MAIIGPLRSLALEGTCRHCPIIVLGVIDEWLFVIDGQGQHHALEPGDLTPRRMSSLCAPRAIWLPETFPAPDRRQAFDTQAVRAHIYSMAFERGLIDPQYFGFDVVRRGRRWIWEHSNGVLR